MVRAGLFVSLEGGEGTGKSTQARRLADWLRGEGRDVVQTREPGGTPIAETLRTVVLSGRAAPFGALAEATLFSIARADHVAAVIRPALDRGATVVCDRYIDSTRAYQGLNGVADADLDRLEAVSAGGVLPHLTLLLDMPVARSLARMRARMREGRADADRFETLSPDWHHRLRDAYLAIAAADPARVRVIDADRDEDAVFAACRVAVADALGERPT